MRILVWKGSWQNSSDIASKIARLFPDREVSADATKDPMPVTISNARAGDAKAIRRIGGVSVHVEK